MHMKPFTARGILPLCNQLGLHFYYFYYGINPGKWKSRLPLTRLIFVLRSDGESLLRDSDATVMPLTTGSVVLIPAFCETVHEQNPSMFHFSIHFSPEFCGNIDPLSRRGSCRRSVEPETTDRLLRILENGERLPLLTLIPALCWNAIADALSEDRSGIEQLLDTSSHYTPLFQYLAEHCRAGIDVGTMAEVMQMKRETFSKKFVRDFGISPKIFFNRMLLARAARMIAGSDMTVREVAKKLDFCNEFYFSRFFKRMLGSSPLDYRRHYRHSAGHEVPPSILPRRDGPTP